MSKFGWQFSRTIQLKKEIEADALLSIIEFYLEKPTPGEHFIIFKGAVDHSNRKFRFRFKNINPLGSMRLRFYPVISGAIPEGTVNSVRVTYSFPRESLAFCLYIVAALVSMIFDIPLSIFQYGKTATVLIFLCMPIILLITGLLSYDQMRKAFLSILRVNRLF